MKTNKKYIALVLMILMVFNVTTSISAQDIDTYTQYRFADLENTNIKNTSNFYIDNNGITINGRYYTIEEFKAQLNKAIEISTSDKKIVAFEYEAMGEKTTNSAIIAGSFSIPGIGLVVVTAAGTIYLGTKVVQAGSWLYNEIINWFNHRAIEKSYEKAKSAGIPTEDHSKVTDKSALPTTGNPYSSKDLVDKKGTKQRRYYGKDGKAEMDIDYRHQNDNTHTFPHRHDWINGKRGKPY